MNRNKQPVVRAYARVATREQITGMETPEQSQKAYVYARVAGGSSAMPGADFDGSMLEAQSNRLSECAESMGFEVVEKDAENARMGISENAFQKMLKAAASGTIQAVIVAACSRLHRDSEKVVDLLEELDHCGVRIYSQQEGWINVSEDARPSMLQLLQMLRSFEQKEGALNGLS